MDHIWKLYRASLLTSEFLLQSLYEFSSWLSVGMIVPCWVEKSWTFDRLSQFKLRAPKGLFDSHAGVHSSDCSYSLDLSSKLKGKPLPIAKANDKHLLTALLGLL